MGRPKLKHFYIKLAVICLIYDRETKCAPLLGDAVSVLRLSLAFRIFTCI